MKYDYILLTKGPRNNFKNALLTNEQKENSENVFKIFESHMIQKPNKWVECFEFTSIQQNEETVNKYQVRLQMKAQRCDFSGNKEERIFEQIIKGLKCSKERRNLISKPKLTLKTAMESIRTYKVKTKDNVCHKETNEGFYPSAEKQSVYSTAPADWAMEEISHKLVGAKHFSKLDTNHGYWLIHLDEESSLLMFQLSFWYIQIFEMSIWSWNVTRHLSTKNGPNTGNLRRTHWNICIYSRTIKERNKNMIKMMDTAQRYGLVFNKENPGSDKDK